MKPIFRSALVFILSAGVCLLIIVALSTIKPPADRLKAVLQKRLGPELEIRGIAKSPIAGLYEVNIGEQIIYSDRKGAYLLFGPLVDAKTKLNLTEMRRAQLNRIDFMALPFADAIKTVKGDGARKIAVFADPVCKYCQQLEQALQQVDNVTIYTFLYPVLAPASKDKARALWCADDRRWAWRQWMIHRTAPPPAAADCDTGALDRNLALGQRLHMSGVPTIFFADGQRIAGVASAELIERELTP